MLKKNTAGQFIYFALVNSTDGSAHTGQSPTGYQAIDGAAQGALGGSIAENANGQYEVTLSQGDTNGDEIGYFFTNSGSIPVSITVTTETKKMADLNDLAAGALMGLADDAITASKYDESTAYPVASADTGASQIARVGADGDTLESLSDEIAALPTDANVTTQCALALSNAHLDHLLLTAYAGEGTAGSILKDLLVDDAGTYQFTANSLELGPSGGTATIENQTLILEDLADIEGTGFVKDTDSLVDLAHTGADADTLETLSDQLDAVPDAAGIESECNDALVALHLDHLLAVAYAGEGTAGAIFLDLIEDDGGTYRYTTNALEQAPSGTGGDASAANQVLLLEDLADMKGTGFVKDTDSMVDLAHIGADSDTLEDISDEIAAVAASLATTDGKVDDILEDTGTTLDTIVDSILEDTGTTLPGLITTVDTVVDLLMDIAEGDHEIDDAGSPLLHVIKRKSTATVLVSKELYELDDTAVDAVSQVVSKELEA